MSYYKQEMERIRKEVFPRQAVMERIIHARQLMDQNCCNELDIKDLSAKVFLSKFHFTRTFTRCYGCTPYQYLTAKRITAAKKLLRQNGVTDTCYHLGFQSPASFSLFFKKHTGISPSWYRKKAILDK